MRVTPRLLLALAVGLLPCPAFGQGTGFTFFEPPLLLRCAPYEAAYFRTTINAVDAEGKPVAVALDDSIKPGRGFRVLETDRKDPHNVLLVSSRASGTTTKGNYVMLLLDTSGSMLWDVNGRPTRDVSRQRFYLARNAIKESLKTFEPGVDNIAIAPFDSHGVVRRITDSPFRATSQEVAAQVDAVRTPSGPENTAIYSAIVTALPILQRQRDAGYGVALVIFSDGQNDVRPGDDPELLQGAAGFADVLKRIAAARVPVFPVGFGVTANSQVVRELQQMAFPSVENFYNAETNPERLTEILQIIRRKQSDQYQLLFGPVREVLQDLRAKNLGLRVTLSASGRTTNSRNEILWHAPTIGEVVPEAQCTTAEARAITLSKPVEIVRGWERLYIFAAFAAVLAALWFAAPRFVWPDAYIPRPVVPQMATPNIAGVQLQQAPQPQQPSWDRVRGSGGSAQPPPAPPARGGGAARPSAPNAPTPYPPSDQTIVIPSRPGPASRPATPARPAAPPDDGRRGGGDETVFMPPPPKPPKR